MKSLFFISVFLISYIGTASADFDWGPNPPKQFFSTSKINTCVDALLGVLHLDLSMLKKSHTAYFSGGKLYLGLPEEGAAQKNLLNTNPKMPQSKAIWVLMKNGELRITKYHGPIVHHTSLTHNEDVVSAGEMEVLEGEIQWVSNYTGHYHASFESLIWLKQLLSAQGIDVQKIKWLDQSDQQPWID